MWSTEEQSEVSGRRLGRSGHRQTRSSFSELLPHRVASTNWLSELNGTLGIHRLELGSQRWEGQKTPGTRHPQEVTANSFSPETTLGEKPLY